MQQIPRGVCMKREEVSLLPVSLTTPTVSYKELFCLKVVRFLVQTCTYFLLCLSCDFHSFVEEVSGSGELCCF